MNLADYELDVENEGTAIAGNFDPLPNGNYEAIITAAELKAAKTGNGEYLEVVFEIIEGIHTGRKIWNYLNIKNKSDIASKIARQQLASICKAIGLMNPQDTSELLDKPLVITVRIDKQDTTRNKITAYASSDGTHAEVVEEQPKPAAKKKPWQK